MSRDESRYLTPIGDEKKRPSGMALMPGRRLTKEEIVLETIAYYSTHPRATSRISCVYLTEDGRRCAFSRCCTKKFTEQISEIYDSVRGVLHIVGPTRLQRGLMARYRGHDAMFWVAIQHLHDRDHHWNGTEFLEAGYRYVTDTFPITREQITEAIRRAKESGA